MIRTLTLMLAAGAVLWAQEHDVIFTRGVAVGGAAAGLNTFQFVAGELVNGNPVKGAPYAAEAVTETTQTLADGNRIVNRVTAKVYRDGAGRERREQSIPALGAFAAQGDPPKTIFISDPVAGVNYSLNPATKTAIKLPVPPTPPAPPATSGNGPQVKIMMQASAFPAGGAAAAGPPVILYSKAGPGGAAAPVTEQLGTKVVEGVQAEGTRTTVTIAAGQIGNDKPIQIVDETWRSPDLQVIVHSEHSDPRSGNTVYSLQNISRSDPAPALFQVPPDYTVKDTPPGTFQKFVPPPGQ